VNYWQELRSDIILCDMNSPHCELNNFTTYSLMAQCLILFQLMWIIVATGSVTCCSRLVVC